MQQLISIVVAFLLGLSVMYSYLNKKLDTFFKNYAEAIDLKLRLFQMQEKKELRKDIENIEKAMHDYDKILKQRNASIRILARIVNHYGDSFPEKLGEDLRAFMIEYEQYEDQKG